MLLLSASVLDPSSAPAWTRSLHAAFVSLARLGRVGPSAVGALRALARWGAHHSGLPVFLVAALALVLSWRVIKRTFRLALEVVLALALLVVATRLGWLTW
jgi:hypothetical protein